jgi:hypothetical protein
MKMHLNGRFAPRARGRFPVPALFAVRARHHLLVPINMKLARIKGLLVMGLPALILTHGPQQIHLVLVLTCDELFARGVGAIDDVDIGQTVVLRKGLVNRINDRDILIRGQRRFYMGDDMGGIVVT